ncbi:MAG: hypothetical protein A2V79_08720 [Betaproteobacteria bacterium RBG_16_56_24]|nr:MAG: hypothetical protein A2V79_08720 [Betaproteobacteria bacterium RBG_16_56_24]
MELLVVTGFVPVRLPDVALSLTFVTVPLPIVVGTVTISPGGGSVPPVDKAVGLATGFVIANAIPVADVTVMFWVVVTVATPAEFSHSAVSTTVPAAVGVNVSGAVAPTASVTNVHGTIVGAVLHVPAVGVVTVESVPAPVLAAPIEKRMVWLDLPIPPASIVVAVASSVPAPTWILLPAGVRVSVEPLISIGILADCPPTDAVTMAVRLLKSARPLLSVTIAWPFASVVAVLAFRLPLLVEKETATPDIRALDESTSVAVRVAEVALSVTMEFVSVPIAMVPAVGVVDAAAVSVLSLHAASNKSAVANRNTGNLVMALLKISSRTLVSCSRSCPLIMA